MTIEIQATREERIVDADVSDETPVNVTSMDLGEIDGPNAILQMNVTAIEVRYTRTDNGPWVASSPRVAGTILGDRSATLHEVTIMKDQWQPWVARFVDSSYPGAKEWAEKDLAYNGDSHPMRREPTPRERDMLTRLLRDLPSGQAHVDKEELALFPGLMWALCPRSDDEMAVSAMVAHDGAVGPPPGVR